MESDFTDVAITLSGGEPIRRFKLAVIIIGNSVNELCNMHERVETRNAEEPTTNEWHRLALRKQPEQLRNILLDRVSALVTRTLPNRCFSENLRALCVVLATSFPLDVRTDVLKRVASVIKINSPEDLQVLLLLHLLTNVKHVDLRSEEPVHLGQVECNKIMEYLRSANYFRLETLRLEGMTMAEGLLSHILSRSPRLLSVHVSGELCDEVLKQLQEKPCNLRYLQLDSCTVCDEDVVRALVGSNTDFHSIGNAICNGDDVNELEPAALQSLRYLSVESPRLSVCGALVLLVSLRNLQQIQYTAWSSPISETLLLLRRLNPSIRSYALNSLAQWQPTEDTLRKLQRACPRVQSLMIECYDPTLTSLEVLAEFSELKNLTLRLVSEELIVSAVKALGKSLQELVIEFEEYTYHSISTDTVKAIQENCPHLQRLEMKNVNISSNPGDHMSSKNTVSFPELKQLTLSNTVIHPAFLEKLLSGNRFLESLILDVNQDALTDGVLITLQKNNLFHQLSSIFLGAGTVSVPAITSLLTLPGLRKLALDLKRFPFIPVFAFNSLERSLTQGNFQCELENVLRED